MASPATEAAAAAAAAPAAAPAAPAAAPTLASRAFVRQAAVDGWDDAVIASQVALVLGVGGIGCSVAMCLGRLGVREIILLDCDTVDATNLNRQLLFGPGDVGRPKADAAAETLRRSHAAVRTTVTPVVADAIAQWGEVVLPLLARATVVFNAIDWGGTFDAAVAALCLDARVPYASASSYAHTAIAEAYPFQTYAAGGGVGETRGCVTCANGSLPATLARFLSPASLRGAAAVPFMPHDDVPATGTIGSSVLPCTMAAESAVTLWMHGLFPGGADVPPPPNQVILSLRGMDLTAFHTTREADCMLCSSQPLAVTPAGIRALAFGPEPVVLAKAPGAMLQYATPTAEAAEALAADTAATLAAAAAHAAPPEPPLPRLAPVAGTGNLYVPCLPAADLPLPAYLHPAAGAGIPVAALRVPLVKTAVGGTVHGVRSGARSAIVFGPRGTAYRLKGCGMFTCASPPETLAFPVIPMAYPPDGVELRGCMFEQTAVREQVYADRVARLLADAHLVCGNRPVGVAAYAESYATGVASYCGVYATEGDKRLASHLLAGLDLLAPYLASAAVTAGDPAAAALAAAFPAPRHRDNGSIIPIWEAAFTGATRQPPVDFRRIPLPERAEGLAGPIRAAVAPHWHPLWDATVAALTGVLASRPAGGGGVLPYVYGRLGREVGVVQRLLSRARLSWGYFIDHNPFEPHNNAHPNNLVVMADSLAAGGVDGGAVADPGAAVPQYLAPVDFDMMFSADEFLSNFTGAPSDETFGDYTHSEVVEMRRALGGEMHSSTGLAADGPTFRLRAALPAAATPAAATLVAALRDTLSVGWEEGWAAAGSDPDAAAAGHDRRGALLGTVPPGADGAAAEHAMRLLVRLALMLTDGINT